MASPGWPVHLADGPIGLRPLRHRDASAWSELRIRSEGWLAPWEGRPPGGPASTWADRNSTAAFGLMLRVLRREAKGGRCLPFAITDEGVLAGQVTVSNVVRGALQSASIGYWVDPARAGRGLAPTAVALAVDHCFTRVGLHRVEANVRPENAPSLRVVDKVGFRPEGHRERFLFIDGDWRDHLGFALTVDDVPEGVLQRMRSRQQTR